MHVTLVLLAWLVAFAWLYKLIEAARGLATVPNLLAPEYDAAPAGSPSVTVIVPARNEAAGIGVCLESLLGQDYANLRVLAVDDRSTDQTGAIMDASASTQSTRLEVLHITTLPANRLGKTHAMALAARHALATHRPDYLLFTDADIVFRRDAIRRSLTLAVDADADHFVLLPTLLAKTHGEAMILSYLQVMEFVGSASLARTGSQGQAGRRRRGRLQPDSRWRVSAAWRLRRNPHGGPRRFSSWPPGQAGRPSPAYCHRTRHGLCSLGSRSLGPGQQHDQEYVRGLRLPPSASGRRGGGDGPVLDRSGRVACATRNAPASAPLRWPLLPGCTFCRAAPVDSHPSTEWCLRSVQRSWSTPCCAPWSSRFREVELPGGARSIRCRSCADIPANLFGETKWAQGGLPGTAF